MHCKVPEVTADLLGMSYALATYHSHIPYTTTIKKITENMDRAETLQVV